MNQEDHEDFFAREARLDRELHQTIAAAGESEFSGLVDASGTAGVGAAGDDWNLVIHFAAWKQADGTLREEELRVEMLMSREELSRYRARITAYDITRVRGRMAWDSRRERWQAVATEIRTGPHKDPDLEAVATRLKQPVTIKDAVLGTFTLDRRVNTFQGTAKWQGRKIRVSLDGPEGEASLATARTLWSDQERWSAEAADRAAEELLDNLNSNWLDEGEEELSAADFRKRITLESVCTGPDGSVYFYYDDDYLFGGHAIQVSGNVNTGLSSADLAG